MFLDIGLGLFAAMTVSAWYDAPLTLAAAGIALALLPDADFLFSVMRRRNTLHHRDGLHYPLLYIPIGAALLSFFGPPWAMLFALASLGHFIHDSIGIGWGVQWLFPFVTDHYSFFYIYKPRWRTERLPRRWRYIWKHDEIDALDARYGDPDWIRNICFKRHPYATAEFIIFLIALLTVFWQYLYW